MKPEDVGEEEKEPQEKKVEMFLGCANGMVYKFEKKGNEEWQKAKEMKLQVTVSDVLQTAPDRILTV